MVSFRSLDSYSVGGAGGWGNQVAGFLVTTSTKTALTRLPDVTWDISEKFVGSRSLAWTAKYEIQSPGPLVTCMRAGERSSAPTDREPSQVFSSNNEIWISKYVPPPHKMHKFEVDPREELSHPWPRAISGGQDSYYISVLSSWYQREEGGHPETGDSKETLGHSSVVNTRWPSLLLGSSDP